MEDDTIYIGTDDGWGDSSEQVAWVLGIQRPEKLSINN